MAFHKVGLGDPALPSDVNQYAEVFAGEADVGMIRLASPVDAPNTVGVGVPIIGFDLEVGEYQYAMTYVTGIRLTDGSIEVSGETELGPSWEVETTAGNQRVELTSLPSPVGKPTIVAKRLYRTTVGGAEFRLVTTLGPGVSSYIDQTPDDDLGDAAPTKNTTGTFIAYDSNKGPTTLDSALADLQNQIIQERNRMYSIVGEQNLHIWQLESELIKTQEGFTGFVGEPFLPAASFTADLQGEIAVLRSPQLSGGGAVAFATFGMNDQPTFIENGADVFPNIQIINYGTAGFAVDPDTNDEYALISSGSITNLYKRARGEFHWTVIPDAFDVPPGEIDTDEGKVAWTSDARYVAMVPYKGVNSPLLWYKRVGDRLIKLPSPAENITRYATIQWDPSNTYLAVASGQSTSPRAFLWKRTGDSLASISLSEPRATVRRIAWHPSGQFLGMTGSGGTATHSLTVWRRLPSSDSFTKVTIPTDIAYVDDSYGISWSQDFLAIGYAAKGLKLYTFDTSTYTFTDVTSLVPSAPTGAWVYPYFTPDGRYMFVIRSGGLVSLYRINTPTSIVDLSSNLPSLAVSRIYFSSDATFVLLYQNAGPCVLRGGNGSATATYGHIILKPVTLPTTCNSVYLLENHAVTSGNISLVFKASLNGGSTWETIAPGSLVKLNHTGTSLTVRVEFHRPGGGQVTDRAQLYWVAAYATYV